MISNLLINFLTFDKTDPKRFQTLEIMANMLKFDVEERVQVNFELIFKIGLQSKAMLVNS